MKQTYSWLIVYNERVLIFFYLFIFFYTVNKRTDFDFDILVSPFIPYWLRPKAHKIHQRYQHLVLLLILRLCTESSFALVYIQPRGCLPQTSPRQSCWSRGQVSAMSGPRGGVGGWTFVPSSGSGWMALSQREQQIERAGWTALTFNLWDKQRQKKKSWCVLVTKAHDEWKSYSLCEWFLLFSKISLFYQSVGALCFISAYKWQ